MSSANVPDGVLDMLVAACRHLAGAGLSPGSSGNLSVRVGDAVVVTPTGSSLARVKPGELSILGPDGEHRSGPAPTKEVPLHLAIYRARADAAAVVHTHSVSSTAVSCLGDDDGTARLPAHTMYHLMKLGRVPLVPVHPPGSANLGADVGAAAADHDAILLAHHGPVCVGRDLWSAVDLLEELETAARLGLLLRGSEAAVLDPDDALSPPGRPG
jgi:3-dehydro-4-phosphotetronate decarboxylase